MTGPQRPAGAPIAMVGFHTMEMSQIILGPPWCRSRNRPFRTDFDRLLRGTNASSSTSIGGSNRNDASRRCGWHFMQSTSRMVPEFCRRRTTCSPGHRRATTKTRPACRIEGATAMKAFAPGSGESKVVTGARSCLHRMDSDRQKRVLYVFGWTRRRYDELALQASAVGLGGGRVQPVNADVPFLWPRAAAAAAPAVADSLA